MNRTDLLSIYDARTLVDEASALFSTHLNAGEGFEPGELSDDYLVVAGGSSDKVDVYDHGDRLVLVGDVNGPWAIEIS